MSKRKNLCRDDYEKEFSSIKQSLKGARFAYCSFCNCDINLESIVKAAISAHNATQKHKDSARQTKSNQSINNFFKSQSAPTNLDQCCQLVLWSTKFGKFGTIFDALVLKKIIWYSAKIWYYLERYLILSNLSNSCAICAELVGNDYT